MSAGEPGGEIGEPLQSAEQFAARVSMPVKAVQAECRKGYLPAIKVGRRWFVRVSRVPYLPETHPKPAATLSVFEVASRLDMTPAVVRWLCAEGKIPAEKVGRKWRIRADCVKG